MIWRILVVALAALVLVGCENGNVVMSDDARAVEKAKVKKRGDARKQLFAECMAMAAKMPRQADDDVADIVGECSSSAYYMTNYIE